MTCNMVLDVGPLVVRRELVFPGLPLDERSYLYVLVVRGHR